MSKVKALRILHGADFHMDSPINGLPREKALERREELRQLPRIIAEAAVRGQADLIVLPGDLLDSENHGRETAESLINAFAKIHIPVFIAPGNHDYYSRRSPYARLKFPENVYIFTEKKISSIELPELGVRVWGGAFTAPDSDGMLGVENFSPEKKEGFLDICVIHGSPDSSYNPITKEEIARSGMDYLALGHVHSYSGLKKAGDTFYAYPGVPMGRGFDECGEKGIIFADLKPGECEIHFLPLEGRRYEDIELNLDEKSPAEAIREILPTEPHIYRITLKGETDSAPDLRALYDEFEGAFFHLELRDRTRLCRDIWESYGEDTLKGLFISKLKDAFSRAETSREKELIMLAAKKGLAALDNEEDI